MEREHGTCNMYRVPGKTRNVFYVPLQEREHGTCNMFRVPDRTRNVFYVPLQVTLPSVLMYVVSVRDNGFQWASKKLST